MSEQAPPAEPPRVLRVVDHGPRAWFLFAGEPTGEQTPLYLDARCDQGAFGFSVLVELDAEERAAHAERGSAYLDELARAIHDSAPAARGTTSPYRLRDLTRTEVGAATSPAVREWRQRTGGT